jgi:hypothetical protein
LDIALLRSEIRTPLFVLSVPAVTTTLIRILLVRVALIRVALILLWRIIRLPLLRGRSGDAGNIWQRDCDPRLLLLRRRERTPQERRNCPSKNDTKLHVNLPRSSLHHLQGPIPQLNAFQTGLQAGPTFNGYRFQIAEIGTAWLLGPDDLPGAFAIGGWDQTGTLTLLTPQHEITQNGTHGAYAFASQRLWRGSSDGQASGVSGFMQLGTNNSRTMFATRYVGLGLTAFGVIPSRPADSLGAGLAWSGLNRNRGFRPDEALIQVYDQIQVFGSFYLQPTLTFSPNPGETTAQAPAFAFTLQSTILF